MSVKPEDKHFKHNSEVLTAVRGSQQRGAGRKIGAPTKDLKIEEPNHGHAEKNS